MSELLAADVARYWWLEPDPTTLAIRINSLVRKMWRNAQPDRDGMFRLARLYGNVATLGISTRAFHRRTVVGEANRLSFNIVKAVCQAYQALITKDAPKASFITTGADWDMQQRAKNLEKFSDGALYETGIYDTWQRTVLDSAIWPFGAVTMEIDDLDPEKPRLSASRTFPWELLYDDDDAVYGTPRVQARIRYVDRYEAEQRYPKLKGAIRVARSDVFQEADMIGTDAVSDLVTQIEVWRLPRSSDSGDGRYVKLIGDAILVDKKYNDMTFPTVRLYREEPRTGVVGQSLAEDLSGVQFEINSLLLRFQKSYIAGAGHWMVQQGSQINTNQINDVIGAIIRYQGVRPDFVMPVSVTPDQYAHLDRLWAKGFEQIGVSQQAAMAQKPAGLNSGKAQIVYADVQTQRLKPAYKQVQAWFLGLTRMNIRLARQIAEKWPKLTVRSSVSRSVGEAVKWADANLDESDYLIKMYATNALAEEPAAMMQAIADLVHQGVMEPGDGAQLLAQNPDLESFMARANASSDLTMQMVERMLKSGKFEAPEPTMNLQKAIRQVQDEYLLARLSGAPMDRRDLLLRWLERAKALLPSPPPTPAPAGPTPGATAPTPMNPGPA